MGDSLTSIELLDLRESLLVSGGRLDGWDPGGGRFRSQPEECGDGPGIASDARGRRFSNAPSAILRTASRRMARDSAFPVVRAIVARHGGSVSASQSDLGGADLRLEFPLL